MRTNILLGGFFLAALGALGLRHCGSLPGRSASLPIGRAEASSRVDAASSTLAPVQWQEQQGREDMPTDSNKEHGPLLGDASIRELLLEIAAAEESLVQASQQRGGQDTAQAQHRLEAAVGKILDHPQHLLAILALLGPAPPSPQEKDADLPEGLRQLNAREEYGAVRAICWVLVVSAGRGVERPLMLSVLSALPMVLPEMREQLIANITNARVDGRLILDASYLEDLLFLRSQYPDDALVFSALFVVMGDDLTDEQRHNLFSQFYIVTDDPLLVGLTLKNLLLGHDPHFGLFLAEQRFNDPSLAPNIKAAIANAVVNHADVFSATSFLVEQSDSLRNTPALWMGLGIRPGATEALEAEYFALAEENSSPGARRSLVMGMSGATVQDLLNIARTDPEGQVIGQALISASAHLKGGASNNSSEILSLLRNNQDSGGIHPVQTVGAAANIAIHAKSTGDRQTLDSAVALMTSLLRDQVVSEANRNWAIGELKRFLSAEELKQLKSDLREAK